MPRILFLASHRRGRSPSQRYRFEQYMDFLEKNGFQCDLSPIICEKDDQWFYSGGHLLRKALILLKSLRIRSRDRRSYNSYDIVFVQREALMVGSSYFEKKIATSSAKFLFDFDDSIWLMDTSDGNKRYEWLKDPEKTAVNIRAADLVFAGNAYLAEYARQFNPRTVIVPTTIDTEVHRPDPSQRNKEVLTIGWSGSRTTIKHFESAVPVLKALKEKYGGRIRFSVMGDAGYTHSELGIRGIAWTAETEVAILNSFDIGIMPLPDDEWAKGKCGLKGLSYMACEVPAVMSPVGVNTDIIRHGENGMLAGSGAEWIASLSELIENAELRREMGKKARQTVLEKYSVEANKDLYLENLKGLLASSQNFGAVAKRS